MFTNTYIVVVELNREWQEFITNGPSVEQVQSLIQAFLGDVLGN